MNDSDSKCDFGSCSDFGSSSETSYETEEEVFVTAVLMIFHGNMFS